MRDNDQRFWIGAGYGVCAMVLLLIIVMSALRFAWAQVPVDPETQKLVWTWERGNGPPVALFSISVNNGGGEARVNYPTMEIPLSELGLILGRRHNIVVTALANGGRRAHSDPLTVEVVAELPEPPEPPKPPPITPPQNLRIEIIGATLDVRVLPPEE